MPPHPLTLVVGAASRPRSRRRVSQQLLAATCAALLTLTAHADDAELPPAAVQDLPYGNALYYFFQEKYFSSSTAILVDTEQKQLPHHQDEAELLLGGMYLSYGLFNEAERIFEQLISKRTRVDTANRAWFHLAQIFYQRDHIDQALRAIGRIEGTMPGDLGIRKVLLHANLYMRKGEYNHAVALLEKMKGDSVWSMYGQFNLGIALMRAERPKEGIAYLKAVSNHKGHDVELAALKDKAHLALGYASIKNNDLDQARNAFRRVRLDGPSSNAGLFGLGQTFFVQKNHHEALNFWLELAKRSTRGPAVFEALLAVPQAYALLDLYPVALQHYEHAMTVYENEIAVLDSTMGDIVSGNLFDKMILRDIVSEEDWPWDPKDLPEQYRQHYITQLFASYEFNEALRNYRDLLFFRGLLSRRRNDMDAFTLMLTTRKRAFEERLPKALAVHAARNPENLAADLTKLTNELESAAGSNNLIAFANPKEFDAWQRLERIGQRLDAVATLPPEDIAPLRAKYELLRGRVLWDINDDFKPRLHAQRLALQISRDELKQADRRYASVLLAKDSERAQFSSFTQRIDTNRQRIDALLRNTNDAIADQQAVVRDLAIVRLRTQQQRIRNYLAQAQYGAAQINDMLSQKGHGKAKPKVGPK